MNRNIRKAVRCLLLLLLVIFLGAGCADNTPANPPTTGSGAGNKTEPQAVIPVDKMTVTLYFATKDASALVAEKREVAKNNHPARTALEELIAGPKNTELTKVVPSSVQVKDIRIKDHVAYVDFSESFVKEHWGGSAGEILTISAVINTLTEFSEIKRVQFLVEGKVLETLKGHLDTSDPLPRNEAIIKK